MFVFRSRPVVLCRYSPCDEFIICTGSTTICHKFIREPGGGGIINGDSGP
jgi:hypothetical protein